MITKLVTSQVCNNISWDHEASKVQSAQNKVTAAKIGDFILAFAVLGAGIAGIVCGGSPDSMLSILGYAGVGTGGIMLGGAMWNVKTYQKKFDAVVDGRHDSEVIRLMGDGTANLNQQINALEAEALLTREWHKHEDNRLQSGVGEDDYFNDYSLGHSYNPDAG